MPYRLLASLCVGYGYRAEKAATSAAAVEAPSADQGPLQPTLVFTAPQPGEHVFHDVWFTPDGRRLLALNRPVQVFDFDAQTGQTAHTGWLGFAQDATPPPKPPGGLSGPEMSAWQARYATYKEQNQSVTDLASLDGGARLLAGGDRGAAGLLEPDWSAEPAARVVVMMTVLQITDLTERLPPQDGAGGWPRVMASNADSSVVFVGGGPGDTGTAWLDQARHA